MALINILMSQEEGEEEANSTSSLVALPTMIFQVFQLILGAIIAPQIASKFSFFSFDFLFFFFKQTSNRILTLECSVKIQNS